MIIEAEKIVHVSSLSHNHDFHEMELEEPLFNLPRADDDVACVFVGRLGDDLIVCQGRINNYETVSPTLARLVMRGVCVSLAA